MPKSNLLLTALTLTAGVAATSVSAEVILQEDFSGSGANLDGTTAEVFDAGITTAGGSSTWDSSDDFLDDGSVLGDTSSNRSAFLGLGSYINDTKGQADGLFVLEVTISNIPTAGNRWISVGFSSQSSPNNAQHFLDLGGTANVLLFSSGEARGYSQRAESVLFGSTVNNEAHALTLTLDLRDHNGTDNFGSVSYETDQGTGPFGSFEFTSDQDFTSLLLSNNADTTGTLSALTLTQVPEPGSLALLGLGGLMIARRRRQA